MNNIAQQMGQGPEHKFSWILNPQSIPIPVHTVEDSYDHKQSQREKEINVAFL